jgi:hypothetical protein
MALTKLISRASIRSSAKALVPKFIQQPLRWRIPNKVMRWELIQKAIRMLDAKKYLEIGVSDGICFSAVAVQEKIGVDPIPPSQAVLSETSNPGVSYFTLTSDEFFDRVAPQVLKNGVDVVFIDGLHTYSQAYRDCTSALKYLNIGGLILLHDCLPTTELEARVAVNYEDAAKCNDGTNWDGAWLGDVWKAIIRLRTQQNVQTCTLHCDRGIGLVYKGKNRSRLTYTLQQIDAMSFSDLTKDSKRLLNLRKPFALHVVLEELKSAAPRLA